jgi:hypothetical protein
MTDRFNARIAIPLLAVVAALSGCGGGDTGSTTSTPAPATVAASTCATPPQLFTASVLPAMTTTCLVCHRSGAVASGTGLVFTAGATPEQTYGVLRVFAATKGDLLLSKSIGQPTHSGGAPFGNANSQQYKDLAALLPQLKQSCSTEVLATGQMWEGVGFADDQTVLAKAAVLFGGRNPTYAEKTAVSAGGNPALRATILSYMTGPSFNRFLNDVGDLQFLPQGVVVFGNNRGLVAADWPAAAAVINNQNVAAGVRNRFQLTIQREPINMQNYVVNNNRPWTDMVAGKYTVVNGLVAPLLGAQVQGTFMDPNNDNEFLPAYLPNARMGGLREQAGVMTDHAYLDRFPTTDTNRNRHRVSETMKRFLALYIPELSSRPLEDGSFRLPIMENPGCAACHDIMDPMAGGFQNWSPTNRFRPNGAGATAHALSQPYLAANYPTDAKGNTYYVPGDAWYRDSKAPGFGNTLMPNGYNNPTAAEWLGTKMATDSRFALGGVHYWFKGLTNREPLRAPTDTTGPDAAGRLAAYNGQHEEFLAIAARFASTNYNVKELLVDLVTSKTLRANSVTGTVSAQRAAQLADTGSFGLLSSTMLNQKFVGLLGSGVAEFNNPIAGAALSFSDFDGQARKSRAKDYTVNQISVVDRIAAMYSPGWVMADFNKPNANRLLVPGLTLADTPATKAGSDKILANIQYLHAVLWKHYGSATDPEVQRTYNLALAIWNDRASVPARPVTSVYNDTNDPNYMGRTWSAIIGYMVGDPRFLYE